MIERHVVSLELSQRLKDAGFPQECYLSWCEQEGHRGVWAYSLLDMARPAERICAAPLLSEVMEQIARDLCTLVESSVMPHGDQHSEWGSRAPFRDGREFAATGPDAAARLWLALKEGK